MADPLDFICAWVINEKESFDQLTDMTEKKNKEHGANLCQTTDGNLVFGVKCEGSECAIQLPDSCGTAIDVVGTFHTHPKELDNSHSEFSGTDILGAILKKERITCLGYEETLEESWKTPHVIEAQKKVHCYKWKVIDPHKKDSVVLRDLQKISLLTKSMDLIEKRNDEIEEKLKAFSAIISRAQMPEQEYNDNLYSINGLRKFQDQLHREYNEDLKDEKATRDHLISYMRVKGYLEDCNG